MIQFAPFLTCVIALASSASARCGETRSTQSSGRALEGVVFDNLRAPVKGAMVLAGPVDPPLPFTEGAMARTDAKGNYRIDLAKQPWAGSTLRFLVLVPGFKRAVGRVEAGIGTESLNVELSPQPWRTTEVRLLDPSGHAVSGATLTCLIPLKIPWSRVKTDAEGRCRVAMAVDQPFTLQAKPAGARPIRISLANLKDDPVAMTVSLLPAIRGRVRDQEGRPLAGVRVGRAVCSAEVLLEGHDELRMLPHYGDSAIVETDDEGRFVIAPEVFINSGEANRAGEYRPPATLCLADREFRHFAFRLIDLSGPVEPLDVTIGPGREVHIPIEWSPNISPPGALGYLSLALSDRPDISKDGHPVMFKTLFRGSSSVTGSAKLMLPEGKYTLSVVSEDTETHALLGEARQQLLVPPGTVPLVQRALRLEPTFHQGLVGKPAPEIEAADLDTGRVLHLSDFRGKVVVLDFWGYWCGPCVGSMPRLIQLRQQFQGQPLEIVALHDQSVQSRSEYDRRIAAVRKDLWNNEDLPFHVLLDRPDPTKAHDRYSEGTGLTCSRYRIEEFPTTFVIDQQGRVIGKVHRTQPERLEALVRGLLGKGPLQ
jgi:thiol-disulfide isomerase/thioredoxin